MPATPKTSAHHGHRRKQYLGVTSSGGMGAAGAHCIGCPTGTMPTGLATRYPISTTVAHNRCRQIDRHCRCTENGKCVFAPQLIIFANPVRNQARAARLAATNTRKQCTPSSRASRVGVSANEVIGRSKARNEVWEWMLYKKD